MVNSLVSKLPGVRNREGELVYVYFISVIALVVFYIMILVFRLSMNENNINNEPLNFFISPNIPGLGRISGWKLSHFISFYVAGFLFPNYLTLIFILGVTWEVIENVGGKLTKILFPGLYDKRPQKQENEDLDYQYDWISGDIADIIYNTAGMFLGAGTRKIYNGTCSSTRVSNPSPDGGEATAAAEKY